MVSPRTVFWDFSHVVPQTSPLALSGHQSPEATPPRLGNRPSLLPLVPSPSEIRLFRYTANITFSLSKFPFQCPGTFSRFSSDPSWSTWGLRTFLRSYSRLWAATDGTSLVPTLPCCQHSGWMLKEKQSETLSSSYHYAGPWIPSQ